MLIRKTTRTNFVGIRRCSDILKRHCFNKLKTAAEYIFKLVKVNIFTTAHVHCIISFPSARIRSGSPTMLYILLEILLRINFTMTCQHFPTFQISGKSMLEIISEVKTKGFIIFPFSTF